MRYLSRFLIIALLLLTGCQDSSLVGCRQEKLNLQGQLDTVRQEKKHLVDLAQQLSVQLREADEKVTQINEKIARLRVYTVAEREKYKTTIDKLNQSSEKQLIDLQQKLAAEQKKLSAVSEQLTASQKQAADATEKIKTLESKIKQLDADLTATKENLANTTRALQEKTAENEKLKAQLAELQKKLEQPEKPSD